MCVIFLHKIVLKVTVISILDEETEVECELPFGLREIEKLSFMSSILTPESMLLTHLFPPAP